MTDLPRRPLLALLATAAVCGCSAGASSAPTRDDAGAAGAGLDASIEGGDEWGDAADERSVVLDGPLLDATDLDGQALDPDAACATSTVEAQVAKLPVDIVWMVDNSASMRPAVAAVQAGLNEFAALIGQKSLDYKVILLSLRGTSPITQGGSKLYPVCVPEPLAGDPTCGNGARFFHANVDILSTQPLEQFLGTLGQTSGYRVGDSGGRGSEPWRQELRASATKTVVLVTDDDSRLSADEFEHYAGGPNPNNGSYVLPPGVLDPSWGGLFDGYTFDAIYGWGSATDPTVKCSYPGGAAPPKSGMTYTTLVKRTAGVRAQICDQASSQTWQAFFDGVAQAVERASKIDCSLAIPAPDAGTVDPSRVNVQIEVGGAAEVIPMVADAASCGADRAWSYDDPLAPTKVVLCPAACEAVNGGGLAAPDAGLADAGGPAHVRLLFGCTTKVH